MSKSITAEELKTITDQQKELGQVLNQIGQLEANKHSLLHKSQICKKNFDFCPAWQPGSIKLRRFFAPLQLK